MTDKLIDTVEAFEDTAIERIRILMEDVMTRRLARCDFAIWHWAQTHTDRAPDYLDMV